MEIYSSTKELAFDCTTVSQQIIKYIHFYHLSFYQLLLHLYKTDFVFNLTFIHILRMWKLIELEWCNQAICFSVFWWKDYLLSVRITQNESKLSPMFSVESIEILKPFEWLAS